jgi:hypothetical protein
VQKLEKGNMRRRKTEKQRRWREKMRQGAESTLALHFLTVGPDIDAVYMLTTSRDLSFLLNFSSLKGVDLGYPKIFPSFNFF